MCSLEGDLAFLKLVHKADLPQAEASPRNGECRVNTSVLIIGPRLVKHTQKTAQETSYDTMQPLTFRDTQESSICNC